MIDFKHDNNERDGKFEAVKDGKTVGMVHYTWNNDEQITLDHTEVDPSQEGEGLGKKLVQHVEDFAREKNLKINPTCRFAAALFQRDDSFNDVKA